MPKITTQQVKKLRDETDAPIMEVRRALLEAAGDETKAKEIIKKRGLEKVAKRVEREAAQGLVETYVHGDGRVGAMVRLACETDFVARTSEFKNLAKELAMQVASMSPTSVEDLLKQEYIRDPSRTIEDLVKEVAVKTGENVSVREISRFALGQ